MAEWIKSTTHDKIWFSPYLEELFLLEELSREFLYYLENLP